MRQDTAHRDEASATTSSARSLLVTLFGDMVLPSGGSAWLGTLTTAMDALDVSPGATRQALRRLADRDLVTTARHGRLARYHLTDRGRARFRAAARRIYLHRDLTWDGRWRLLHTTVPEAARGARALRRELEWLGFGSLGNGTWVCPWDLGVELATVLDAHRVAGDVRTFSADLDGEDAALAARAFDLTDLRGMHRDLLAWHEATPDLADLEPAEAFVARLDLVHRWRKVLFVDPGLPDDVLPEDWLGERAGAVFLERYRQVEQAAWRHWDEISAAADPRGRAPTHRSNLDPEPPAPAPTDPDAEAAGQPPADDRGRTNGAGDSRRTEEFLASLREGRLVEPHDWMPQEYRRLNLRFIEMHANSEIMGALPEREWIPRAPTLRRKRSLAAKVQDEVGHGQLIYRVAETLGKSRRAMYEDLVNGVTSFHNVFHYPTHSWGDVACIGFLVDGAAIVTQRALLKTSYGPYVRVMKRVVAEESLHYRHGEDIMLALASGTDEQFAMLQEAVDRWWEPIMHFFGTNVAAEDDPGIHWGIKSQTNEASRQAWLSQYLPKMWDMGLEVPEPVSWNQADEVWEYPEPDWDRLRAIVKGEGTEATRRRLALRQRMQRHHDWLRDVLLGAGDGTVTAA